MKLLRRIDTFAEWEPLPESNHSDAVRAIANKPENKVKLKAGESIWISQFGGLSRSEIKLAHK